MSDLRKAAEMALEEFELFFNTYPHMEKGYTLDAREALRQALAQPEQEWDSRHPKAQALIGERSRLRIELGLVEQLVDDPHFETTPTDMEHWGSLHDKLKEALTQPEQEPAAWMFEFYADRGFLRLDFEPQRSAYNIPLYTAPPSIEAAVLAEREECAKVCDAADKSTHPAELADAIQARGEK